MLFSPRWILRKGIRTDAQQSKGLMAVRSICLFLSAGDRENDTIEIKTNQFSADKKAHLPLLIIIIIFINGR